MPASELRLIKRCAEFLPQKELSTIPTNTRGIYALLKQSKSGKPKKYEVVYIGMARGTKAGMRSRLRSHKDKKSGEWTHFSIYEVWDNVTEAEVEELEGLFRAIYRKDTVANRINVQRSFKKLRTVRKNRLKDWQN